MRFKLTVCAGHEAAKSESGGDDLHDDCEWIYSVNVTMMIVGINFYTR